MRKLAFIALSCAATCLAGCLSIDTAETRSGGGEHVLARNYGWTLFNCIPIICGNASADATMGCVMFRDDVTMERLQAKLAEYAAGREITVSTRHIKRNPKDFGLVVHETTHVAQAYPGVRETWAMEGATDYIRYYVTEARSNNHWAINPRTSKYTDSYGVTASFYDWIVRTLDPDFMKKIHRVFRIRGSVELFFVEEYGKSCQELWDEYVASLTKETR